MTNSHLWREEDSVIHFAVTSDGTSGESWIARLESKNLRVGDYAKQLLRSADFNPTKGITTEIVVLKGMLFKDDERIIKNISAETDKRTLSKPNAELACLIREKFTDNEIEQMGLQYIVVMHEPTNDSDGAPRLLTVDCSHDGRWLYAFSYEPDRKRSHDFGFAFVESQHNSDR